MTNGEEVYDTQQHNSLAHGIIRFFFVSKGVKDIIKIIQYQYVNKFEDRPVFNMGFADFDADTGKVSDEEVSNNVDPYKVFHTVLSTVPKLFEADDHAVLFVQGSDSKPSFIEQCRKTCTRKCDESQCKKSHRRINIYRGYVDKNYEQLTKDYDFFGGEDINNQNLMEPYERYKKYNGVWVMKKKS
jgi:hypothetical protein